MSEPVSHPSVQHRARRRPVRRRWAAPALAAAVTLAVAATLPATAGATGTPDALAPLIGADASTVVTDRYIVVMEQSTTPSRAAAALERARQRGARVDHTYGAALKGFSASLDAGALRAVRADPAVAYVEADQVVSLSVDQSPATWGLDRIDQRDLPLNNVYGYTPTGAGVRAYVIDTGILSTHQQFSGRTAAGYTAISDGRGTTDCNGHGTHVAGTIGGTVHGVAKAVTLVPVRVLGCNGSGTNSGVIAGVDWVRATAVKPAVANMSLGGGASSALDTAVNNSINSGVTFVVAAGNSNANACSYSPARAAAAITVGSTTSTDARSSFSNYGSCLDVFAPGSSITSAWYTSSTATNTISGTSMASPHVAGVAALYLQGNTSASAQTVRDAIVSNGTSGKVTSAGSGSPNVLLFSRLTTGGGGGTPPPSGCSALPQGYTGSLGSGQSAYQPGTSGYASSASGTHRGCLTGPSGSDFDLYLQRWNGWSWVSVASGTTAASNEDVSYTGSAGTYRWRIHAYLGSGAYTLRTQRP